MPAKKIQAEIKKLEDAIKLENDLTKKIKYIGDLKDILTQLEENTQQAKDFKSGKFISLSNHYSSVAAFQQCISCLEIALNLDNEENKPQILYNFGQIYFLTGKFDAALQYYNQVIPYIEKKTLNINDACKTYIALGNTYFKLTRFTEAKLSYEAAFKIIDDDQLKILALIPQVRVDDAMQNTDAVITDFESAMKLLRNYYNEKGYQYSNLELFNKLYNNREINEIIDFVETAITYIKSLHKIKQFQNCLATMEDLRKFLMGKIARTENLAIKTCLVKFLPIIFKIMATVYQDQKNFSNADYFFEQVVSVTKADPDIDLWASNLILAADHFYKKNAFENSLLFLNKLVHHNRFDISLHNKFVVAINQLQGDIFFKQNKLDEAKKSYAVIKANLLQIVSPQIFASPDVKKSAVLSVFRIGNLYLRKNNEKALECFEACHGYFQKCIAEDMANDEDKLINAETMFYIASIKGHQKNYQDAIPFSEAALVTVEKVNHNDKVSIEVRILKNLIYFSMCNSNFKEAAEYIQKMQPKIADMSDDKTCFYIYQSFCSSKTEQAIITFNESDLQTLDLSNDYSLEAAILGYKLLGDSYQNQNLFQFALEAYQTALSLLAKNPKINLFSESEFRSNLLENISKFNEFAHLENLMIQKDLDTKKILELGLSMLTGYVEKSEIEKCRTLINLIDNKLKTPAPSVAYQFFELTFQYFFNILYKHEDNLPKFLLSIPEGDFIKICGQINGYLAMLKNLQMEYREQKLVKVPAKLLWQLGKKIAADQQRYSHQLIETEQPDRMKYLKAVSKALFTSCYDSTMTDSTLYPDKYRADGFFAEIRREKDKYLLEESKYYSEELKKRLEELKSLTAVKEDNPRSHKRKFNDEESDGTLDTSLGSSPKVG